jgi:hypothetical protein
MIRYGLLPGYLPDAVVARLKAAATCLPSVKLGECHPYRLELIDEAVAWSRKHYPELQRRPNTKPTQVHPKGTEI